MAAKTTRAERRAASRERIASQKAAKEAAALQHEEEAGKRNFRKNLIILGTLLVTMPILAFVILSAGSSVADHKNTINELVAANYEVQDVSQIRTTSFIGDDVMITVDGKMHECRGLTEDNLKAKKPLACKDITIPAKP